MANPQAGNVGNFGDILKHAALVAVIEALVTHGRTLTYVDTHAFMLEAPCPDPDQWMKESQAELRQHSGYQRYVDLQSRVSARPSVYRCSSGLATDTVRRLTGHPPSLLLAEKDEQTKKLLQQQMDAEGVRPYALLADASGLAGVDTPTNDLMFALVDPFRLDTALWRVVSPELARLASTVNHAAVQVFSYENAPSVVWPEAPSGFIGPVATVDRSPFHLAVYATDEVAEAVSAACAGLGWTRAPSVNRQPVGSDVASHSVHIRGFASLRGIDEHLQEAIDLAVARVRDDPRASLVHQRRFAERITELAGQASGVDMSKCGDAVDRIRTLEAAIRMNHHIVGSLHSVRLRGNAAAHSHASPFGTEVAVEGLRHCHNLTRWHLAQTGAVEPEAFALELASAPTATPRQIRREEKLRRNIASLARQLEQAAKTNEGLRDLLAQRPAVAPAASVIGTVPDPGRLKWVYFATPSRANRNDTYDLAYSRGLICCDVFNAAGALKPNVGRLRPGDLMLLAYGQDGDYAPQLYLRVGEPPSPPVEKTSVLYEFPAESEETLRRAGYGRDPILGRFTGFGVTPCGDWTGQSLEALRKPTGQNFLRSWDEVRRFNEL